MTSKNQRGDGCHSWAAVMRVPGSNSSAYPILQDTKCRGRCKAIVKVIKKVKHPDASSR